MDPLSLIIAAIAPVANVVTGVISGNVATNQANAFALTSDKIYAQSMSAAIYDEALNRKKREQQILTIITIAAFITVIIIIFKRNG